MTARTLYALLGLALSVLVGSLLLLDGRTDVLAEHPGVRIGFSLGIAAVIGVFAKDVGERVRARRAARSTRRAE